MEIGIYTQPLRYNYGGLLQAWALQTVLERKGHNVEVLDPYPYSQLTFKKRVYIYALRILSNVIRRRRDSIFIEKKKDKALDLKMMQLKPFIAKHINKREYKNILEVKPVEYDALIVGSDQVWRPRYNTSYGRTIENSFLDFAQDWSIRRIAYAASFGTDNWEFSDKQAETCRHLLKSFDAVSVRESSGICLCRKYMDVDAKHVLDPTMLLERKDYEALIKENTTTKPAEGNLLYYVLNETAEKNELVEKIANEKQLTAFRANSRAEEKDALMEDMVQPPVEQWLRYFQESKFVVTDSFHACVFSILFGIPFIAIANKERGADRFVSLLSSFGLERNLITYPKDYDSSYSYGVHDDVVSRLKVMREESEEFLNSALN